MRLNKNTKKVMVSIWVSNYKQKDRAETTIVDVETFEKFLPIIRIIQAKAQDNAWNWWRELPEKWNKKICNYELDKERIKDYFFANFRDVFFPIDLLIEFFNTFTPDGADGIFGIKCYEYKEIDIA